MDGISDVVVQQPQQSKVGVQSSHNMKTGGAVEKTQDSIIEQIQKSDTDVSKINSREQVDELVAQLNKAMEPMNTNLKFGVDPDNIFYVSVIESETSKMIRRFPLEKAASFLPKMQEVSGILFDSKG